MTTMTQIENTYNHIRFERVGETNYYDLYIDNMGPYDRLYIREGQSQNEVYRNWFNSFGM